MARTAAASRIGRNWQISQFGYAMGDVVVSSAGDAVFKNGGVVFYAQVGVLDASGGFLDNFALSDAMRFRIGF